MQKKGISASEALRLLFEGKWPDFMNHNQANEMGIKNVLNSYDFGFFVLLSDED